MDVEKSTKSKTLNDYDINILSKVKDNHHLNNNNVEIEDKMIVN